MEHVVLALEQELVLNTGGHRFTHTFSLTSQEQPGVPARAPNNEQKLMEIDLRTVSPYNPPATRKKGGK